MHRDRRGRKAWVVVFECNNLYMIRLGGEEEEDDDDEEEAEGI